VTFRPSNLLALDGFLAVPSLRTVSERLVSRLGRASSRLGARARLGEPMHVEFAPDVPWTHVLVGPQGWETREAAVNVGWIDKLHSSAVLVVAASHSLGWSCGAPSY